MPTKCSIEWLGGTTEDAIRRGEIVIAIEDEFAMGCDSQVLQSVRFFSHLFQAFMFMLIEIICAISPVQCNVGIW